MLCPKCTDVFDKEGAKGVEMLRPQAKQKGKCTNKKTKFNFGKRGIPHKVETSYKQPNKDRAKTFVPSSKTPANKWV